MKIPDHIHDILLGRMQGKAPGERLRELEDWRGENEENRRAEQAFVREWYAAKWGRTFGDIDLAAEWSILAARKRRMRTRRIVGWTAGAAACCILAVAGLLLGSAPEPADRPWPENNTLLTLSSGEEIDLRDGRETIVADGGRLILADSTELPVQEPLREGEPILCELSVPVGGQHTLLLPDGSKAILNAESTLRFPLVFGDGGREVYLQGEAFFEVAADSGKPFTVHTGMLDVRVIGTSFNVSGYEGGDNTVVTLVSGSVSVGGRESAQTLAPGQQYELINRTGEYCVRNVDTDIYVSWTEGLFRFDAMPLEQLMKQLKRYYGIEYRFADEGLKCVRFTGGFRKYDNLGDILTIIQAVNNISFTAKENTIVVDKR